jgi:hypothetical protein
MKDLERQRRIARLTHLGIPQPFQKAIAVRAPPRGHTLMHLAIVLISIGLAVLALILWSRYIAAAAEVAARGAGAELFNSDLGLESIGGLLTVLFAAGWLCSSIARHRGSEGARNATAYDLVHEPAKNKAITDRLWRWMIARHLPAARDADDFLDRLAGGMVHHCKWAALSSLALTIFLSCFVSAHYAWATRSAIEDHRLLPWPQTFSQPLETAVALTTGCPVLPRDGGTLIYSLFFADGTEVEVGSWQAVQGDLLDALGKIDSRLAPGIASKRFSNPIGSAPLHPDCLQQFGGGTPEGIERLLKLLRVTSTEKALLPGQKEREQ